MYIGPFNTTCLLFSDNLLCLHSQRLPQEYILLLDYRVVSEGRNLQSIQHGRKRVSLMLIDGGVLPAHAVDFLISGSEDEMHEHWYRAVDVYQKLYTCGNVPCSVQVIVAAPTS